jgi:hypothetical protein
MTEGPFQSLDAVHEAMCRTLSAKGLEAEAKLVFSAAMELEHTGTDGWNGGTEVWDLNLRVPHYQLSCLEHNQRVSVESLLQDIVNDFLPEIGHWVHPHLVAGHKHDLNWRSEFSKHTSASVTNQGRARSDNVASIVCDGLLFRSKVEVLLYKALKSTGVTFAPLPVFLRGGRKYARAEPDFVLIKDGVMMIAEIDGEVWHSENVTDAHYRLRPFLDEGVELYRCKAKECNTPELAQQRAREILELLDKKRRQK